jgi:hypothetical protein
MPLSKQKSIALLVLAYYLTGCSANVDRPDKNSVGYQEFLETKILPDGSKVFNFSLARKRLKNMDRNENDIDEIAPNKTKRKGDGERKGGRGNAEKNRETKSKPPAARSAVNDDTLHRYFQDRLANLKILKMFCRQGYFILEEYADTKALWIKAECKESASVDDYTKFTKVK